LHYSDGEQNRTRELTHVKMRLHNIFKRFLRGVSRLQVIANVVSNLLILVTVMMEALRSSDTSILTRATRRHIPEDNILHSHSRENLKSYIALTARLGNGDVMCLL
jgi:hypothetical protein